MVMSIMHRITGVALYVGAILIAWWFIAAAYGPQSYATANAFFSSWFGLLVLFGFTFALIHHMLGGIKHLVQDTGRLLDKETTTKLALAQPVASLVITLAIWLIAAL